MATTTRHEALETLAVVAKRWAKRKGHMPDHDCDLCNAIRAVDAAARPNGPRHPHESGVVDDRHMKGEF